MRQQALVPFLDGVNRLLLPDSLCSLESNIREKVTEQSHENQPFLEKGHSIITLWLCLHVSSFPFPELEVASPHSPRLLPVHPVSLRHLLLAVPE